MDKPILTIDLAGKSDLSFGAASADLCPLPSKVPLTSYARSGGCSCKLGPADLAFICASPALRDAQPTDHQSDDASVVDLAQDRVLVSSIDFQNPIVDDPVIAGRVAALNALSDLFACGVSPLWAEVILALPESSDNRGELGRQIIEGLSLACRDVGCKVVGGHTVLAETPLIGLAVRGIANKDEVKLKSAAEPGDLIIITKPLGIGTLVSAHQVGLCSAEQWKMALATMQTPNDIGVLLGQMPGVHAMTDLTGFGLLGHLLEVAKASGVGMTINFDRIPLLDGALRASRAGLTPLLAADNLIHVTSHLHRADSFDRAEELLLCDPQTNGPLLLTIAPYALPGIVALSGRRGQKVTVIGTVRARSADNNALLLKRCS